MTRIEMMVEQFVAFVKEHPRWAGTYKALSRDMANTRSVSSETFVAWPMGTKGFTHDLPVLQPLLEARGVRVRVDGKLNQRLKFLVVKLTDVVPIATIGPVVDPIIKTYYMEGQVIGSVTA